MTIPAQRREVFAAIRSDPGNVSLNTVQADVAKLASITAIGLPGRLFAGIAPGVLAGWRARVTVEAPSHLRAHPDARAELWESILAAMKLGAVIVPASTLLGPADVADRVARGEGRHVITESAHAGKFGDVPAGVTGVEVTAGSDGSSAGAPSGAGWHRYADFETALAILAFARERLAPDRRVRRLEFADLPKTISGKDPPGAAARSGAGAARRRGGRSRQRGVLGGRLSRPEILNPGPTPTRDRGQLETSAVVNRAQAIRPKITA